MGGQNGRADSANTNVRKDPLTNSGIGWGPIKPRTRFSESICRPFMNCDFRGGILSAERLGSGGRFIPDIKKVKLVKSLSPNAEIWTLYYKLSPVMSPRVFTVLQVKQLGEVDSKREGYVLVFFCSLTLPLKLRGSGFQTHSIIVSIPINLSSPEDESLAVLEEKGIKGRYASVERILELPGDKVEWRMATSSSAGGLIPQFLTDFALVEAVSKAILNILMHGSITNDIYSARTYLYF